MEPLPLQVQGSHPVLNEGDVVEIQGVWNRPANGTLGWWVNLIFGYGPRTVNVWWFIRRKVFRLRWTAENGPMRWVHRRDLFRKRELLKFKIQAGQGG